MRALAESVGAVYFHFLQPNQYFEGSKRLTEEELAVAWRPEHPWSEAARRGYSRLRQRGEDLAAEGVRFHDLTTIFREHDETIWTDSCCHFNQKGSEIIVREIGATIGRAR